VAEHPMSYNELLEILKSKKIAEYGEFKFVKELAAYISINPDAPRSRDLVLRSLDLGNQFTETREILDVITKHSGLYPYSNPDNLSIKDLLAYEYHRSIYSDDDLIFHRLQGDVFRLLDAGESVILSAPTSFGKSKLIDAIIASGKHNNIAVIVPTLALIDETRRRLSAFSGKYRIITQLSQAASDRNIFILTPERMVAFQEIPPIDFFAIDEFYKIDSNVSNDTRAVILNIAFQKLIKMGGQFYLLGPNVDTIPPEVTEKNNCHFISTDFNTVAADIHRIYADGNELEALANLCDQLEEPTLIYCRSPKRVNTVARMLVEKGFNNESDLLTSAKYWSGEEYHHEWIWSEAIGRGIGIHHGRLPRSLSQYTVRMFNSLKLRFMVCTSTLIEGVNTKAKNVIIFDNTLARSRIDYFTFNNIKGRSGRMFEHFVGNVFLFHDPPEPTLPFVDFPIFTQSDGTPDSLIIQIDGEDQSDASKEKSLKWADQNILPIWLIKNNTGIDPDEQIELAQFIEDNLDRYSHYLNWNQTPSYEQLRAVCKLIWMSIWPGRNSIRSEKQLTFKLRQLAEQPDSQTRIMQELLPGPFAAENADEAVERVLDFERNIAGFVFPRLLMALSSIQDHVLKKNKLPAGDYKYYATRIENLFLPSNIAALDEYGIPKQLAAKLGDGIVEADNFDICLRLLKQSDPNNIDLHSFEKELLEDAISAL
jgi:rhodanese-related sulfurtransferase